MEGLLIWFVGAIRSFLIGFVVAWIGTGLLFGLLCIKALSHTGESKNDTTV